MTKEDRTNMKEGRGRFINRPTKTAGKTYDKFYVYIPTYVAKDKDFPFKTGDELMVRVVNHKLVIEKG
jgi:hypothetical protein